MKKLTGRRTKIILIVIVTLLIGTAIAYNYNAPATTEIPKTPKATVTPTPTATPVPPKAVRGFATNDSMKPPEQTPVPMPTGNTVALSLQAPETVKVGDTFTISVMVNSNGRNVSGIQTSLRFDKDMVQVDGIEMSDEVDQDFSIPAIISNEQGVIENIFGMPSPPDPFPAEEFIFAIITLTAKKPGTAELQLERNVATYASGADTPILMPTKAETKNIIIK